MGEPSSDETTMRDCCSCGETCDVPVSVPAGVRVQCEECEADRG